MRYHSKSSRFTRTEFFLCFPVATYRPSERAPRGIGLPSRRRRVAADDATILGSTTHLGSSAHHEWMQRVALAANERERVDALLP